MIFDATDMDRSLFDRTFDVRVIGSGPAGMTLALDLAATGLDVAPMEGGGLEFTEESQDSMSAGSPASPAPTARSAAGRS